MSTAAELSAAVAEQGLKVRAIKAAKSDGKAEKSDVRPPPFPPPPCTPLTLTLTLTLTLSRLMPRSRFFLI